jgi:16S rRNA (guanine966-N2)-methyltransferase
MRITGGAIRGRRLISMKGLNIRPTSDMVRSAIFNILGQTLNGFTTLDLFAGTGSLGIESLSRGSEKAVFVDNSRKALAILKKNLSICEYESRSIVARGELPKGLAHIKDFEGTKFDLIFIDPPYGKGYISPTLYKLVDEGLCAKNGRVVVESSANADDPLPTKMHDLTLKLTRMYGSTLIGLYTYHEGT